MARIFISHSSANNAEAIAVKEWMAAQGWDDVFLDLDPERGLKAGDRWQEALKRAAERCELVVFLVSPEWARSKWCLAEFLLAKSLNKRIFAAIVAPTPFADLPVEMTAEWQLVDLTAGVRDYGATVTLPPDPGTPGLLPTARLALASDGLNRLRIGLTAAGIDPRYFAWPPAGDPERAPYRGLKPLEAEDAGIFFGRDAPIITALDTLRGLREGAPPRLLVILGASGAGKSSVLRAGLLPRLARDDRHFLPLPVIRPERAVLSGETGLVRSLETALKARSMPRTRADLKAIVTGGATTLRPLLGKLVAASAPPRLADGEIATKPPTLVLSIDQGEELFLAEGAAEAEAFLALLHALVAAPSPDVIALFTIRTDSYEPLQSAQGPAAALVGIKQVTLSLPPMPQGAYAQVIEGPAARLAGTPRALKIEPALTETLLADIEAGGAKDALPLLAFTLERLYLEHGGDGDLKLAEYQELGGVSGSIEAAVEGALRAADANPAIPKDRKARLALLRRGLIPWLAGIDPDSGSPRRRVARLSEIPAEVRPLVDLLVEARLLATDVDRDTGEATIEPAHEALLRQWGLLEGWLEEDFGALTTLEAVKRAARDWSANANTSAWLAHAGGRLEDAERIAARSEFERYVSADDRAYLAACRGAEQARAKRERFLNRVTRAAAVVALIGAGIAGWQWWEADRRKQEAVAQRAIAEQQSRKATAAEKKAAADRDAALITQAGLLADAATQRASPQVAAYATAMLVALHGLPDRTLGPDGKVLDGRPHVPAAESSLFTAQFKNHERHVLAGHQKRVVSAVFSRDGSRIVTASWDKTARLWDVASGRLLAVLAGHTGVVVSALFSQDGSRIVTASADGTARIWDATSGRLLIILTGHSSKVESAEFSPDGKRIVTASSDKTARIWDAKSGKALARLEGHCPPARNYGLLSRCTIHSAAFSADGSRIVTASSDRTARLWDVESGIARLVLEGHCPSSRAIDFFGCQVTRATFSPDDRRIVTASSDKTARLWDAESGKLLASLAGHTRAVTSAAFTPDGRRIVTASLDGSARIWDTMTGRLVFSLARHAGSIESVAFSRDSLRIVTASSDGTARVWDVATGRLLVTLAGHPDALQSAVLSPDGHRVATASMDATARLWDVASGTPLATLVERDGMVSSATFSLDGRHIVATFLARVARLWDTASGKLRATLKGHTGGVNGAAFSFDGRYVVTASSDKTARVWDAMNGTLVLTLTGHLGAVNSAAFSPDGHRIATASSDMTARLWDVASGRHLHTFLGHSRGVRGVTFSPDGRRVLTASLDGTARLWEVASGRLLTTISGHAGGLNGVAFNSEASRIVTTSWDRTARLWDASSGKALATLEGHFRAVNGVAFSPDGKRVVTSSDDGTVRHWDAASGRLLGTLSGHTGGVNSVAFSPDGHRIVTTSWDGTARIWRVFPTTQALVDHAKRIVPRCLTRAQLKAFYLPPEPLRWCITGPGLEAERDSRKWQPKWPYHTKPWRDWLVARDRGETPPLPKE